ncbi:MAG: nuclear transport factor 2 family protein [Thermoleophilaceae bacterium]|jgi:ketosteroid isomerase-like protein
MKRESIELLLDWLDAVRRDDVDTATAALAPDVVWRGVREDLVCAGADEVVANFRKARDRLDDVEAIELIGRDSAAVLGSHTPDGNQIYNVFRFNDGQVAAIEDFATREEALTAATSS